MPNPCLLEFSDEFEPSDDNLDDNVIVYNSQPETQPDSPLTDVLESPHPNYSEDAVILETQEEGLTQLQEEEILRGEKTKRGESFIFAPCEDETGQCGGVGWCPYQHPPKEERAKKKKKRRKKKRLNPGKASPQTLTFPAANPCAHLFLHTFLTTTLSPRGSPSQAQQG
jgi:hypothetical protein